MRSITAYECDGCSDRGSVGTPRKVGGEQPCTHPYTNDTSVSAAGCAPIGCEWPGGTAAEAPLISPLPAVIAAANDRRPGYRAGGPVTRPAAGHYAAGRALARPIVCLTVHRPEPNVAAVQGSRLVQERRWLDGAIAVRL